MTALVVMVAVVAGGLLLLVLVVVARPRWLVDRRRAAQGRWVGIEDLSDHELQRVVVLRGMAGATPDQVRERILRRRAVEETLRRRRELKGRQRSGQKSRAARARRRR